jgi:hypothetical protein
VLVEVDLGVVPLAVGGLETSPEDVAVVNANVLCRVVEAHLGWCLSLVEWVGRFDMAVYGCRQVYGKWKTEEQVGYAREDVGFMDDP